MRGVSQHCEAGRTHRRCHMTGRWVVRQGRQVHVASVSLRSQVLSQQVVNHVLLRNPPLERHPFATACGKPLWTRPWTLTKSSPSPRTQDTQDGPGTT